MQARHFNDPSKRRRTIRRAIPALAPLLGLALGCSTVAWAQDDDDSPPPPTPQIQTPLPPPAVVTPAQNLGQTQLDGVQAPPPAPQLAPIGPIGSWPAAPVLGSQPELGTAAAMPTVPNCLKNNPFGENDISTITSIIVDAGYSNVRGLYEGCDNLWRGHAMMNGMDVSIMVTPAGSVIRAGY